MAERLVVRIVEPANRPDDLSVQEAFAQVVELFDLAAYSEAEQGSAILWKLVSVSKNSPLVVIAEAVSHDPTINVGEAARRQKKSFAQNIRELRSGQIPQAWSTGTARSYAANLVRRNRSVIGRTEIDLDDPSEEKVVLSQDDIVMPDVSLAETPEFIPRKEQIGSIEGVLTHVGTFYRHPAIQITERKTQRTIWCRVSDETARHLIAEHANFEDIWGSHRVIVRGRIIYDSSGDINQVVASDVVRIESKSIPEDKILDKDFTSGLSVAEYLERFSEGTLG